jgi:hypothetical protein
VHSWASSYQAGPLVVAKRVGCLYSSRSPGVRSFEAYLDGGGSRDCANTGREYSRLAPALRQKCRSRNRRLLTKLHCWIEKLIAVPTPASVAAKPRPASEMCVPIARGRLRVSRLSRRIAPFSSLC